jgi:hypothetical protein
MPIIPATQEAQVGGLRFKGCLTRPSLKKAKGLEPGSIGRAPSLPVQGPEFNLKNIKKKTYPGTLGLKILSADSRALEFSKCCPVSFPKSLIDTFKTNMN